MTRKSLTSNYDRLVSGISSLLEEARRSAVRSVNAVLTATYWEIGRRIVEHEQSGAARAEYGEALLKQLAEDLTARHGRGFSLQGIYKMRGFYLGWRIFPTPSGKLEARAIFPTTSGEIGNRKRHTRQISTQFFERTVRSKRSAALMAGGHLPKPEDKEAYHIFRLNLSS